MIARTANKQRGTGTKQKRPDVRFSMCFSSFGVEQTSTSSASDSYRVGQVHPGMMCHGVSSTAIACIYVFLSFCTCFPSELARFQISLAPYSTGAF